MSAGAVSAPPSPGGGDSPLVPIREQGVGAVGEVARTLGEVKAAIELARAAPRDEIKARESLMRACSRPRFADEAQWEFPRGGKTISGPSVGMAREFARVWGNIQYGLRILEDTGDEIQLAGWAFDLQTNTRVVNEARVRKLIQRRVRGEDGEQTTKWVVPDERDLLELVNRVGAKCVRNAILQLAPADLIDEMIEWTDATLDGKPPVNLGKAAEQDRVRDVANLLLSFYRIGVTEERLQAYLGHSTNDLTQEEYKALRKKGVGIKEGQLTIDEAFPLGGRAAEKETEKTVDVEGKVEPSKPPGSLEDLMAKDRAPTEEEMRKADEAREKKKGRPSGG